MPDDPTEALKERLANELADAPQGTRDSEMPMPPPPPFDQVGPSPTSDALPPGDPAVTGAGTPPGATGEEADPGDFDAGGVNATDADGVALARPGAD